MSDLLQNNIIRNFKKLYNEKCSNYKYFPSTLPKVDRIIVLGDIHGDMTKLIKCLRIAKLIDSNKNWIGGETVVVQVGDQIDSCREGRYGNCNRPNSYLSEIDNPDDVNILYFMTDLHKKAAKHGGAVYSLIGNHELMNVLGDMSYVSYNNINHFNNYKTREGAIIKDGMTGRKHAFAPGNDLSNFLACTRKMVLIIGSNIFVHAGVIPYIARKYRNIDDINKLLALFLFGEIEQPDLFRDLFISAKTSPLWTRVFGFKVNNCDELLQPLLDVYKVDKIYVGHTPQLNTGIKSQCSDKIWMTDVGMSHAFNKIAPMTEHRNAQVLEILNDGEVFNILK
jgi:hypothetical protein